MNYSLLADELEAISSDEKLRLSILANAAALLYERLDSVNWAGFYLMHEGRLVLAPFAGKTACTEIAVGKGVCGTAVEKNAVLRVENVHLFDGHIACDSASNSEIVLPMHLNGEIYGVLDIDSTLFARFSEEDEKGLTDCVKRLEVCLSKASVINI